MLPKCGPWQSQGGDWLPWLSTETTTTQNVAILLFTRTCVHSSSDKEVKCNVKMLDEEEAVFVLSASDCGRDLLRRVSDR